MSFRRSENGSEGYAREDARADGRKGILKVHRPFSRSRELEIVFSKEKLCALVYCSGGEGDLRLCLNRMLCEKDVFEIAVAADGKRIDITALSLDYPELSILEFDGKPGKGEAIDAAIRIMLSSHLLFIDTSLMALCLDFGRILGVFASYREPLAITPVFVMEDGDLYPSIRVPDVSYMSVICEQLYPYFDLQDTFYPISFVGIYDRARYLESGGFDLSIGDEHYQLLEFAARAWLLGYPVMCLKSFSVRCPDPGILEERIMANSQKDAVNFRIRLLYKRPSERTNTRALRFLFKAVDSSFGKTGFKDMFFPISFKTLLKRWRIGEVEEVL